MSKIKIAMVGVGSIGNVHLKSYGSVQDVEVYALCDINAERLEMMGKRYGITRLYTDEAQMLAELPEIDAVDVCTWNAAHAPCSIMALEAGKHVLCEKPMAMNTQQAIEMQQAAEKAGKLLMIGFVRRFGRDCDLVRDMIQENRLGEVYYAKASYLRRNGNPGGWFGNKALSGGGPLIDLGVHVIDLVRYLAGCPTPISVYGATFHKLGNRANIKGTKAYNAASANSNTDICDCEDLASAMIRFDNGLVMQVEASFSLNVKSADNCVQLFGTVGGTKIGDEVELYTELDDRLVDIHYDEKTGFSDNAFVSELRHFADVINGKTDCRTPAGDGVMMMRILDAIYASAQSGHEVTL